MLNFLFAYDSVVYVTCSFARHLDRSQNYMKLMKRIIKRNVETPEHIDRKAAQVAPLPIRLTENSSCCNISFDELLYGYKVKMLTLLLLNYFLYPSLGTKYFFALSPWHQIISFSDSWHRVIFYRLFFRRPQNVSFYFMKKVLVLYRSTVSFYFMKKVLIICRSAVSFYFMKKYWSYVEVLYHFIL